MGRDIRLLLVLQSRQHAWLHSVFCDSVNLSFLELISDFPIAFQKNTVCRWIDDQLAGSFPRLRYLLELFASLLVLRQRPFDGICDLLCFSSRLDSLCHRPVYRANCVAGKRD